MARITRPPVPHFIDAEDRSLAGSALYVDLIPTTCWGSAGRTVLASQYEWQRIRTMVYERAGNACEVCGNTREDLEQLGYAPRLHAHERYTYLSVGESRVQRLTRLICQCLACDEVTHIGRTSTLGPHYLDRARTQAMRVNGWTRNELDAHMTEARRLWEERSQWEWKLDVTLLKNAGGRLLPGQRDREVIWD
ncbi:hypothetical protein [Streptomyces sp. NPDC058745]|uniref:hypothetical protein n=1 Tax=Streptomyces sp. NPDC058745 TaxID=3346621 RepID=UPI0036862DD2